VVRAPRSIAMSTMYVLRDLVVPLLESLDAPAGVLNILCGQPKAMLQRWLEHPQVNDIFYIGSSEEGLRIQQQCLAHGKKPILELAGNDGLVVWHDADPNASSARARSAWFPSMCSRIPTSPTSCFSGCATRFR
jgi:acyl-CoA reductase-like NAD-dependent aldehyde dehydrogenase